MQRNIIILILILLLTTAIAVNAQLATLRGFYYTAVIVTDPLQNGPRYYRQALGNFDEALKLNPDNKMARMLQQRFMQGMQQ